MQRRSLEQGLPSKHSAISNITINAHLNDSLLVFSYVSLHCPDLFAVHPLCAPYSSAIYVIFTALYNHKRSTQLFLCGDETEIRKVCYFVFAASHLTDSVRESYVTQTCFTPNIPPFVPLCVSVFVVVVVYFLFSFLIDIFISFLQQYEWVVLTRDGVTASLLWPKR